MRSSRTSLIETGVAHGGSLVFYASLFSVLEKGRVIGIEVDLKPQNRDAIRTGPLASSISLVDGSSVTPTRWPLCARKLEPARR